MILQINDWKSDIDLTATMAYSAREAAAHCDCAYCRNFYAAVDTTYPDIITKNAVKNLLHSVFHAKN